MTILESILLGAVQGLTEFLPVSSSGHLIIIRDVLGISAEGGLAFDLILHLATLLAVVIVFRKDLKELIISGVRIISGKISQVSKEQKTLLLALILGTIPAAVLGFFFESYIESTIREPRFVAGMLLIGSALLIAGERYSGHKEKAVSTKKGVLIGLFQSLALLPGMSRSGATIAGGMLLGVSRITAARFSFLLSIPIIGGSGLKKILDLSTGSDVVSTGPLVAGFISSFLVGWIVVHYFLKFLKNHTLYVFAGYRLVLAGLVILLI